MLCLCLPLCLLRFGDGAGVLLVAIYWPRAYLLLESQPFRAVLVFSRLSQRATTTRGTFGSFEVLVSGSLSVYICSVYPRAGTER